MTLPDDYLEKLLVDLAAGQRLLEEVRVFYGPSLRIERREGVDGVSNFHIDPHNPSGLAASIGLNTTTDRIRAAATHELLHLAQHARGPPVVYTMTGPYTDVQFTEINEILKRVVNVVQHDLFIDEFIGTGLPLSEFQTRRRDDPKYRAMARRLRGEPTLEDRCRWAFEFLNNHISIKHGDPGAKRLADSCRTHGENAMPEFKSNADAIEAWVASRAHLDRTKYAPAIRALLPLLHLPVQVRFCELQESPGSAPRVKLL